MEAKATRIGAAILLAVGQAWYVNAYAVQSPPAHAHSHTADATVAGCEDTAVIALPAAFDGNGMGDLVQPGPAPSDCPLAVDAFHGLASPGAAPTANRYGTAIGRTTAIAADQTGATAEGGQDTAAAEDASATATGEVNTADPSSDNAASAPASVVTEVAPAITQADPPSPSTASDAASANGSEDAASAPAAPVDTSNSIATAPAAPPAPVIPLSLRPGTRSLQNVLLFFFAGSLAISLLVLVGAIVAALRERYFTPRAVIARAAGRALKRNQFYVEYQPIFHVHDRQCMGVELLLRWKHSAYGRRGADWFMTQLGNSPIVSTLMQFMLQTAAVDLDGTDDTRALQIMINLPPAWLTDRARAAQIAELVRSVGGSRVVLQISGDALPDVGDGVRHLSYEGLCVSLCDLRSPTDAARLTQNRRFQFAKLHRDVMALEDRARIQTLNAFSSWGREHDIPIVADGIEGVGQYHAAGRAHIALAQGFFLCKALDPGRLLAFLGRLKARHSPISSPSSHFALPQRRTL